MSTTRLLIVHARSPLHAGTGQATAAVDLPIARDRATGYPLLPGSSIKGALRARGRADLPRDYTTLFGPETENARDHAGSIAFSDARLLMLPVRSVAGTFAWVTSPYLLAAFVREAKLAGLTGLAASPPLRGKTFAAVARNSLLGVDIDISNRKTVVLEEFDLDRDDDGGAEAVANSLAPILFEDDDWQEIFKRRLCIVHDDVMAFLSQHATEIVTRVSINPDTGTASDGQLWTEENLPAESLLVAVVEEVPSGARKGGAPGSLLNQVQSQLLNRPIQLGGKATVGRGRCALRLVQGGK